MSFSPEGSSKLISLSQPHMPTDIILGLCNLWLNLTPTLRVELCLDSCWGPFPPGAELQFSWVFPLRLNVLFHLQRFFFFFFFNFLCVLSPFAPTELTALPFTGMNSSVFPPVRCQSIKNTRIKTKEEQAASLVFNFLFCQVFSHFKLQWQELTDRNVNSVTVAEQHADKSCLWKQLISKDTKS